MAPWACGVGDCRADFETVEEVIIHQTVEHERTECRVCGTVVPEGYFAIRHAFDEHTRAEYVRAYDADADAVREREERKEEIESVADLDAIVQHLRERGALK